MDAMLSGKMGGVIDCIKIVSEMGRVCKVDGYLVIVSHLNAHVQDGIEWLEQVVIAGLRLSEGSGDGTRAAAGGDGTMMTAGNDGTGKRTPLWEIEVHGNDGTEGREDGGDSSDSDGKAGSADGGGSTVPPRSPGPERSKPPSGSPGPAVYIIRKLGIGEEREGVVDVEEGKTADGGKEADNSRKKVKKDDDDTIVGADKDGNISIPLKFFSY